MLRALAPRTEIPTDWKRLVQLVHVKAHELALDTDTRRALQAQLVGKASCRDMTVPELQTVYRRLRVLSEEAGLGTRRHGRRAQRDERLPQEPITKEQLAKIEHLFDDLNIRSASMMMQLSRRACGHGWAQSRHEGNQVIEMLKALRARGWRASRQG